MCRRQKTVGAILLGLLLAAPAAGCARPLPRPAPRTASPNDQIDLQRSDAIKQSVANLGGAGDFEALVMGNVALMAIQMNSPRPGGTEGGDLLGKTKGPDGGATSPSGGPAYLKGPGGSTGINPAMPGGAVSPGPSTPGGNPNWTQAAPNTTGTPATQGTTTSSGGSPGSLGSTPMDVMTRIADRIRSEHTSITEVRFLIRPEDATRFARLVQEVRAGNPSAPVRQELRELYNRAIPAGTTQFVPPTQGTYR